MGRALGNKLCNLGVRELWTGAAARTGVELAELLEAEPDAALGNGGLGRLAACLLDSMATLDLPGFGYGINYEFGLFQQAFRQWGTARAAGAVGAHGVALADRASGRGRGRADLRAHRARPGRAAAISRAGSTARVMIGVPYDMPIVGYGGRTVNTLRLFSARASDEFDMGIFNCGDYIARRRTEDRSESGLQGALSRRQRGVGPRAAPACRNTSWSPAPSATSSAASVWRTSAFDKLPGQGGDPDERHASRAGRRRADARADRRGRHAVGAGVADRRAHVRLHAITR